jgi:hypothetical protein
MTSYADAFDAALAAVTQVGGGWVAIAAAVAFVALTFMLWQVGLEYIRMVQMRRRQQAVREELARQEREADARRGLERIMRSTEQYRRMN